MQKMILSLDSAGLPNAWVSIEEAITYHAKDLVVWSLGEDTSVYQGGIQRNGARSRIETKSIIAIRGSKVDARSFSRTPVLSNDLLFARDRHLCAYCGECYAPRELSRDHIMPVSKGGRDQWTNVVTACRSCNTRKADQTPQQSGMALLYVPYTPNRHEHFILRNRHILADQMRFLLGSVPTTSRLHS
jgi:5-methylcytosine-specific restriction endonuclease McrA